MPIVERAPAKLNLTLHITGKRPDGYHLLDSMVAFAEFGDTLTFFPADKVSVELTGSFAAALTADNSVAKAAALLQPYSGGQGARIVLEKHIPIGAGLGGGSGDAAAALRGLMKLWNIFLSEKELHVMALSLGSDVPVCLAGQPARMRGVGEIVEPLSVMVEAWVLLVNPQMPLATADVYKRFSGVFDPAYAIPPRVDSLESLLEIVMPQRNALEASAIALMPEISEILKALRALPGVRLARMSGSGATCFALFNSKAEADNAYQNIRCTYPKWWAIVSRLQKNTPSA